MTDKPTRAGEMAARIAASQERNKADRWGEGSLADEVSRLVFGFAWIALDLDGAHLVVPWASTRTELALGLRWRNWHDRKSRGHKALPGTASLTLEQALAAGARHMHRDGWLFTVRDMLREQLCA